MLILTCRVGEAIMIGEGVSITVMSVIDRKVRIGVSAPKEITVHRQEVYERIQSGIPFREDVISSG